MAACTRLNGCRISDIQHGALPTRAFNMERNLQGGTPLVDQGVSDDMLGARDDVPFVSEQHGIAFEGEFAVILGDTPAAATAEQPASSAGLLGAREFGPNEDCLPQRSLSPRVTT